MAEGDDERDERSDAELRRAMTSLHQTSDAVARSAVAVFRPRAPLLIARIVDRIQHDVDRYTGSQTGRRHKLITMAVTAGINHFLDMVEKGPTPAPRVDDLFRRMGYGEAIDGRDLQAMHASFRIATRDAWDDLRSTAEQMDMSAAVLGTLGDALFGFIEHLTEQTSIGHRTGTDSLDRSAETARIRLLRALLDRGLYDVLRSHAADAVWPLPQRFVVLAVNSTGVEMGDLPAVALMDVAPDPVVVVCGSDNRDDVITSLRQLDPDAPIAVSWPVRADDVPAARRWAERALLLAEQDVIAAEPVIECARYRTHLWLHAEPALRRQMCQDLLRPLLAETPNSREILSETLLVWLETRDSAPAIAAQLGVHPQTVRYRWKRINELFGDDLREPEFMVQITMLLKASVPLWKAGDQSDFERYHQDGAS